MKPPEYEKGAPAATARRPAVKNTDSNTIGAGVNSAIDAHSAAIDEALGYAEPGDLFEHMFENDVLAWQIKRAALLALLHIETRSFQEVADTLGVSKAAISKEYVKLVDLLGWKSLFRRVNTRRKNALAAQRYHHARDAAEAKESA